MDERPRCLVYMPFTYDGRGVPETCANLVRGIGAAGLDVHVYVPRVRKPLPDVVSTHQTLPPPLRYGRWKHVRRAAIWSLDRSFRRALERAEGLPTVAYFWPSYLHAPSLELLQFTRAHRIPSVREMVNTATSTSGPILDEVYARHGHAGVHNVSAQLIEHETAELPLYDYIFAPGSEVERSLRRIGISEDRVLPSSYGWRRERFQGDGGEWTPPSARQLRLLFVGIVGVRKGVPELLDAWKRCGVEGELLLVGNVEPAVAPLVDQAASDGAVRHLAFADDVASLFRSADIFVFPSHEEGAPLVIYEAAACGLPIITTPMGTARVVESGTTGIVVPAGDVDALASAIRQLAESPQLRQRLGTAARRAADQFEYEVVGRRRAEVLRRIAVGAR